MSLREFELKAALKEWRSQMIAGGITKTVDLDELESHLIEDFDKLIESGLSDSEAFVTATKSIGHPALVKNEFKKVENQRKHPTGEFIFFVSLLVFFLATTDKSHVAERSLETVSLFCFIYPAILKNRFLNHAKRMHLRPYALVLNFISAVLLTGPEIIAQAITALILQLLFEVMVQHMGRQERHLTTARE